MYDSISLIAVEKEFRPILNAQIYVYNFFLNIKYQFELVEMLFRLK